MAAQLQFRTTMNDAQDRRAPLAPIPRVFVVDDDISVRESLESLLRFAGWRVESSASAHEFLNRSTTRVPGCLVLDVSLPDLSGLELQQRLEDERAYLPIVFITGHGDVRMTVNAMKAGAVEFLTKPFDDEALLAAVRQAIEYSRAALDHDASLADLRARYNSLTRRERQVMAHVVAGYLNKQIAAALDLSEITVKAHRGKMTRKMGADTVPHLVKLAARLNTPYTRSTAWRVQR